MRRGSLAMWVLAVTAALAAAGCGPAGSPASQRGAQISPSVRASVSRPSVGPAVQHSSPIAPASPSPSAPVVTSPPAATPAPSSPAATPPPAVLTPGMSGPAVLQLQQQLAALKYYPGPADGEFGMDTEEAVWAFQETQGLPTSGTVGPQTQAALANPSNPAVLVPDGGGTRVEVNLADEVLVLYQDGQVALVSHVSSGGGYYFCTSGGCAYAVTPTGDYQTTTFMPGWVTVPLGEMYNPVFFIGTTFAIHGDTDVPLQPVSHGCIRIPMDIAQFFHTLIPTPGTPVYVRG